MVERNYSVNKAIKQFLEENDKKASAIADKAGIRRDVFWRIINSKRVIYADELFSIVAAVGMPLETVIAAVNQKEVQS